MDIKIDKSHSKNFPTSRSNESIEDYLEAILVLSHERPVVRSVDIAEGLGFKKPSVSIAMKKLRELKYITVSKEGYIYLTESGKQIADDMYERHIFITNWLVSLGVNHETARIDACRIEHVLSKESFDALKSHAKANHSEAYNKTIKMIDENSR